MTFLSLLAALLLGQAQPLLADDRVQSWLGRFASALERHINGGHFRHGVIAWALAVAPALLVTALAYQLFYNLSPFAAWLWNAGVLYLTMGFRQFSRYFTEIELALRSGDLGAARDRLGKWRAQSCAEFDAGEIARAAIEQGLIASHRHVFGIIAWFVALGPAGAVLYRASAILSDQWSARSDRDHGEFGRFAGRVFVLIDWVPGRLTAAGFAVAGDFEDAIYCWRTQAAAWGVRAHGVILAAGGGALGVRLGGALHESGGVELRPELGTGDEADVDSMRSAVGLVWRALVLWMFLVFLVSLVHAFA